jgi:TonB family protein
MTRSWSVAVIGKLAALAGAASFASVALARDEPSTEAIVAPRPEYPSAARSQHLTGSGVAVVQVDPKSGHVTSGRILDSTGHKILDDAALKAFRQWRFKPGGTSEVHIPISYGMRGYTSDALNARAARLQSQAKEAFRRQDYDVTIRSATQALQLAPGKVSLRELRALAYYRKGDNDAAISDYDEIIRLNATLASAYVIRGSAYLVKGWHAKALADFNEAIRIDPKNASAYCDRADLEGEVREPDKALRDYDKAIQLAPKFQRAYFNRALHFIGQREYARAISDLSQAIRLLPNDLDAYAARAKAYAKLGDHERAVADAKLAVKLRPTTEIYLQRAHDFELRATAYKVMGQSELALRDLRESVRLAPNYAGGHEALAWFLATCPEERVRNGTDAVSSAMKACEISHWTDSGYIDTLAAAYAEVGDFEQATKYEQQSLNDPSLAQKARMEREERLQLYKLRKPYRDRLDGST